VGQKIYGDIRMAFDNYLKDGEFPTFKVLSKNKIEKEDITIYSLNDDMQNLTVLAPLGPYVLSFINSSIYSLTQHSVIFRDNKFRI
jgi:hypothetical protein